MKSSYGFVCWDYDRVRREVRSRLETKQQHRQDTIFAYLLENYTPLVEREKAHGSSLEIVFYQERDLLGLLNQSKAEVSDNYLYFISSRGYVARTAFVRRLENEGLAEKVADFCRAKRKTPRRPAKASR